MPKNLQLYTVIPIVITTVISSMHNFTIQIQVQAADNGVPAKTATTQVYISISRDQNFPVFNQSEYNVNLQENTPTGTTVATVHASDKDVSNFYWILIA